MWCCSQGSVPNYLGQGWHEVEPEYTWMAGEEANIRFRVRRPNKSYTLKLNVISIDGLDHRQSIEVFFNYFRVGFGHVRGETTLEAELPAALFMLPEAVLGLHCSRTVRPSEQGGQDTRLLGVALRCWSLA